MAQERIDWNDPARETGTVSAGLRYLIETSGKTVKEISKETHISAQTMYSMMQRNSDRADLSLLKKLADYFDVDLTIFCGIDQYDPPRKLEEREQTLLATYNSLTDAAKARVDEYISDVAGNPKNRV